MKRAGQTIVVAGDASVDRSAPPQAPLAFRVGVVGHRPNRLQKADLAALTGVLREILLTVRQDVADFHEHHRSLFADVPPVFRAVSPLAEGSDRLFAEQAINIGYELCCPMPFARSEFEKDFAPAHAFEADSLARFRSLLERAEKETALTVFELDGERANEGAAYGAAGRVVLNQSDLLVVVWDGERQEKPGGTEETFAEAGRKGVPVVWIDAVAPHPWQLLKASAAMPTAKSGARVTPASSSTADTLRQIVQDALDLPNPPKNATESAAAYEERLADGRVKLEQFYSERKPRFNPAILWKWFRDIAGESRWSFSGFGVPLFEKAVEKEWPRDGSTATARVVNRLRPFYAWPDRLAVAYSDAYRSAFVLAYLLAAGAVCLALLPVAVGWFGSQNHRGETACFLAELFLILTILATVLWGRHRRWHERWIDYRLTAELVRHLSLMAPLGGSRPYPQFSAHLVNYGHPGATWVAWYVRAVERDLGLPSANMSTAHQTEYLAHLAKLFDGQLDYHRTNTVRYQNLERRLHWMGMGLLSVTLLACILHFLPGLFSFARLPQRLPPILTFLCGFLPATGAALAGISNQGEFRRLAKRSGAMAEQFEQLREQVKELQSQPNTAGSADGKRTSSQITDVATQAAQLMVNEVLDWRVVSLDQPLKAT
jgi:hypothetical protein